MRKLELSGHLEASELYERYRLATDGVLRSHYQMMWHLAEGMWVSECAAATGYTRRWIEKLAQRYNAEGPEALGDRRRRNKGARPLLDAAQLAALAEVVSAPPPDGGLWSGRKVAAWIATEIGRAHVHPQRGWAYLRRLDLTWQTPRPAHDRAATPEAQAAYKKTPRHRGSSAHGAPPGARRGLGLRRAPPRPEAADPSGVGAQGAAAPRPRSPPLPMALPLRLRPPGQRPGGVVPVQHRQCRGFPGSCPIVGGNWFLA